MIRLIAWKELLYVVAVWKCWVVDGEIMECLGSVKHYIYLIPEQMRYAGKFIKFVKIAQKY